MILLTTANARYSHTSLGLRYLYANMQNLQSRTVLVEHTIKNDAKHIVDCWLSYHPKIIGIGMYIWNVDLLSQAIFLLKKSHPHLYIVVGGPEVSYDVSDELFKIVDYIIPLAGDLSFKRLCQDILDNNPPKTKALPKDHIDLKELMLPYEFYTDKDIATRKMYVEASRGCVFKCQFCLSSLDTGIQAFDTRIFLSEIKKLYQRGARLFKFIDRTFNLDIKQAIAILSFFLEEFPEQDYFLHLEVIPDRIPSELKEYILRFKEGVVQFEVGIQTLDEEVSALIGRPENKTRALENLNYLRRNTNIHLHVDLLIGLPGATLDIFREDLNRLVAIGLQEIQIGILKYLKGTSIIKHADTHHMIYDSKPPYEIESTMDVPVEEMSQLKRFAKYWERYYNSGNFIRSMELLFQMSNPFCEFFKFSAYAYTHLKKTYGISLDQYSETLYHYLVSEKHLDQEQVRKIILKDMLIKPGRKVPRYLKDYALDIPKVIHRKSHKALTRQINHSF